MPFEVVPGSRGRAQPRLASFPEAGVQLPGGSTSNVWHVRACGTMARRVLQNTSSKFTLEIGMFKHSGAFVSMMGIWNGGDRPFLQQVGFVHLISMPVESMTKDRGRENMLCLDLEKTSHLPLIHRVRPDSVKAIMLQRCN